MNLVLTDEQRLIRDSAQQFFRERGGVSRLRAHRDAGEQGPGLWSDVAALGWVGLTVPERWGGAGLGLAEMTLITEAAGRVLAPEPLTGCAVLAGDALSLGGSDAQCERWLPRMASGEALAALGWDERGLRGDVSRTMAEARPDGDGFMLNGAKQDVSAAGSAELLIVSARVSGSAEIALWLVDARAPGVTITPSSRFS